LNELFCVIRDRNGEVVNSFIMEGYGQLEPGGRPLAGIKDEVSWVESLYFSPVSEAFLAKCVEEMIAVTHAPKVLKNEAFIRTAVLEMTPDRWRILIFNQHLNYKSAHLDVGRPIESIKVLTDFPGIPVIPRGSQFSSYVPGRGMVMVELTF